MFQSWTLIIVPTILSYIYLASTLRHRRVKAMHQKYPYPTRDSFCTMTVADAHAIHNSLAQYEFPKVFSSATMFALFKAYGIPSISSLLVTTGQFTNNNTSSKRVADTSALLLEAALNPPGSSRSTAAIARINYLHNRHRARGTITGPDLLYTLSLFALEPSRWVARFEWRALTDMELCALGTFWKSMGDALEVPYDALHSHSSGWRDGLEWLQELRNWSREYEEKHMVPAASNKRLADATLDLLLWKVPRGLHGVGKNVAATVLEERLRAAMMIDAPPRIYDRIFNAVITIRKLVLRYLSLPRRRGVQYLTTPTPSGRLHLRRYRGHPWYVEPTVKNRWGVSAWLTWWRGGALPGDEGEKYAPEGFLCAEVGPSGLQNKGLQEMEEDRERMMKLSRGGCPFALL
ncbi:MAG: hypothetical protein FRX48_08912 [Lasallia pustulata]|uniref:ER-bound oxygenase mpaB/mpaB'/Rubber oxygenase catalytic domain-containing protein n=1 Tax=Lasallia pustulata TaxID=136370 RepID=A0A5M8PEL7_9LECA|nr:MAG: hypothetical protein FRX48_08912 [Lasallia pustulata]